MDMILLGIGIVSIFLIYIGLTTSYRNYKTQKEKIANFNKKKAEIITLIEKDRADFAAREEEKISSLLSQKQQELNEKTIFIQNQEDQLLIEYEQKKKDVNDKINSLQERLNEAIDKQARIESEQLQATKDFYATERANIDINFINFKAEIEEKISALKLELKKEEVRQQEIIEEYKRAEQIRQNKNFYRIVLSDNAQSDVVKLRHIAEELHDPSVLYKLIYKTYYERPFNEMIGRVITGKGSIGIYKITNLQNGRVYIGQTKQAFKERWRTHLKRGLKAEPGTQNKLYNAMWEDGAENFTFEVLSECEVNDLNQKEKEYISLYHADTWGYNSTTGNS